MFMLLTETDKHCTKGSRTNLHCEDVSSSWKAWLDIPVEMSIISSSELPENCLCLSPFETYDKQTETINCNITITHNFSQN